METKDQYDFVTRYAGISANGYVAWEDYEKLLHAYKELKFCMDEVTPDGVVISSEEREGVTIRYE